MSAPATHATDRWRRIAPWIAWGLVALFPVSIAGNVWYTSQALAFATHVPEVSPAQGIIEGSLLLGLLATLAVVGALIVARRPHQLVGWIMLGAATTLALGALSSNHALATVGASPLDPPAFGVLTAWVASWYWWPFFVLGFVLLPLIYPDGRLPSPRWRPLVWASVAFIVVGIADGAVALTLRGRLWVGNEPTLVYEIANPIGVPWLSALIGAVPDEVFGPLGLFALFIPAVGAVVVRFRRASGRERLQIKWLAFAGVAGAVLALASAAVGVFVEEPPFLLSVAPLLAMAGVPVAIGVALLRYRLYEIDRIISRTVSYGLVVAVLGGVYVAGVVGLGAVVSGFAGEQGGDLVVATSVLAVVALFRPVTSRVQRAVDRRFNRSGYEARLAVEAFTQQARDDVELEAITRGVAETAAVVVQPAHVSLWLDGDRT